MTSFHVYLYGPDSGPIPTTFEAAAERLEQIRGVCFEPDGSFGFRDPARGSELYGMLYDAGGQLQYVDMRGTLNQDELLDIVGAIAGNSPLDAGFCILKIPSQTLQTFQSFLESTFA